MLRLCAENQKTALVGGATGFISYHILNTLMSEGSRAVGLDFMSMAVLYNSKIGQCF